MPEDLKPSFVAGLAPDTTITSTFLVLAKDLKAKKDGEPFLDLLLGDRTGSIKAVMWDNVEASVPTFERNDFVKVRATVNLFRDKPQLRIERLRPVPESEINIGDYLPATTADVDALWSELCGRIAAIANPDLKALLEAIFLDPDIGARFRRAPAAKVLHHAFLGGLLEHVTSLCRMAEAVAPNYPFVDRDLLLAGILLHDLGKIAELEYARSIQYTTDGQLLGHIIQVLRILHAKIATLPGFPPSLQTLLEHLVISHHGKYEFGSPKLPMFPEALLLHCLDDMDSKMQAMRFQLESEPETEAAPEWTTYNRSLERPLLRVRKWTQANAGGK